MSMEPKAKTPLLSVGHEAEWAEINREEVEHHRRTNMAMTPAQRLDLGQKLSQQAVSLARASPYGRAMSPDRAFWS